MKTSNISITILLFVAIIVLVNFLSEQFFFRVDLTENRQYTLSDATREILKNLDEPVTVKAYFSKDIPAQLIKTKNDFQEMLVEYGKLSKQMVVFEFISPNEDEEIEREAMQNGIQPVMINVREKDQMQQQRAYMGAVLSLGDQKEIIPLVQPGLAMEYTLSTAIKKLSVQDKPVIGLLQGHGEASLNELTQAREELNVLYTIENVTLTDSTSIPAYIRSLAIIRPTDTIPAYVFDRLDAFLASGGNIFLALDRVSGDLQNGYGSSLYTGLEGWLRHKGLSINDNFLVDMNCVSATMQQQLGNAIQISSVAIPYIPRISQFADHPATQGIDEVILQFTSTMDFSGDSTITYTPLLFSSEYSGTLPSPQYFNYQRRWMQRDFPLSNQVLGAALEGALAGPAHSRMVVISDGDFPINPGNQQINPDNVNLMVNSIDWLSDDTGLIELRTKGVISRPIKQMEDSTRSLLKWINFLLPILLVLIYGVIRYQYRKNQRVRRMEANYV
ncbi:MAG: Gldg family protein [Bacteroidales bacterium]|nr:Gldg family protein [Bacteroidales bacterium]MBN2699618.1 Gldg family protein [Bacteroidales bacterium]